MLSGVAAERMCVQAQYKKRRAEAKKHKWEEHLQDSCRCESTLQQQQGLGQTTENVLFHGLRFRVQTGKKKILQQLYSQNETWSRLEKEGCHCGGNALLDNRDRGCLYRLLLNTANAHLSLLKLRARNESTDYKSPFVAFGGSLIYA